MLGKTTRRWRLVTTEERLHADMREKGNIAPVIKWYEDGADGQIDWGEDGDFEQCVAIAGKYVDDPEGFCQLRHIAATGEPAGKAPGEKEDKSSARFGHEVRSTVGGKPSRSAAVAQSHIPAMQAAYATGSAPSIKTALQELYWASYAAGLQALAATNAPVQQSIAGDPVMQALFDTDDDDEDDEDNALMADVEESDGDDTSTYAKVAGLAALLAGAAVTAENIVQYMNGDTAPDPDTAAEQMTLTEAAAGAEAGAQDGASAAGFTQMQGVDDDGACQFCQDSNDEPYDIGDDGPPWHQNCSCESQPVGASSDAERSAFGRYVRRAFAHRDWAEWDEEHPYVPHPAEAAAPHLTDTSGLYNKEYPTSTTKAGAEVNPMPMPAEQVQANLQSYFDKGMAGPSAAEDAAWYQTRHDEVVGLAEKAGVDPATYTAVLASTSPLCPWQSKNGVMMNVNLANKAIETWKDNPGVDPKTFAAGLDSPGMLKSSLSNAMTALNGNVDDALSGPKIRSFNNNISDPSGRDVTMDTWMARAMAGNADLDEEKALKSFVGGGSLSKPDQAKYSWGADMVRQIADAQTPPMTPNAVQAVIWTQVKRETTIRSAA